VENENFSLFGKYFPWGMVKIPVNSGLLRREKPAVCKNGTRNLRVFYSVVVQNS